MTSISLKKLQVVNDNLTQSKNETKQKIVKTTSQRQLDYDEKVLLFQQNQHKRELEMQEELERFNLKLEKQERDFEQQYMYRSCCFALDKRVLDYACKVSVILIVLIFCIVQLTNNDHDGPREVYFSLISSIITLFINPPKIDEKNSNMSNQSNGTSQNVPSRRKSIFNV